MRARFYQNVRTMNPWLFTGVAIALAVILTTGLNLFFSLIGGGKIVFRILFFGTVDAIVIPAVIAPIILNILKRSANLEELNRQLQREIAERQRAEQTAQQRAANLQAISNLAVECAAASPDTDLPGLIAEKLQVLTGALAVGISMYDVQQKALIVQHLAVSGQILSTVNKLLGRNIIGLPSPVSPEMLNRIETEVVRVSEDLSETTFGAIPRPIAAALQRTFGVGSFTGLGLCYAGELWGTAVIVSRADQPPLDRNLAMALAYVAAVALRRQKADAERQKVIGELESKNVELEQFTYTVSHDLRSPLITVRGFLGFLEKDALAGDTERVKADIARIYEATDKMQRLLGELLELSRVGRLMNPAQALPFEAIAREAVASVQGRIQARGIRVEIAPNLPIVHGDRARLVEVVQNLIDNAAKFMGDQLQPYVQIGTCGPDGDGKPVFFVRDNGIGIDPQYHERVFGLFNKLDAHSEGTGIGLALAKRIIEVHRGRIWVESEGIGHGSTFCFTLPDMN
jgi:signal transduction histidine kinase